MTAPVNVPTSTYMPTYFDTLLSLEFAVFLPCITFNKNDYVFCFFWQCFKSENPFIALPSVVFRCFCHVITCFKVSFAFPVSTVPIIRYFDSSKEILPTFPRITFLAVFAPHNFRLPYNRQFCNHIQRMMDKDIFRTVLFTVQKELPFFFQCFYRFVVINHVHSHFTDLPKVTFHSRVQ